MLLVGAIGIANVTLVSVIERTGGIGLRRAIGASRRHIASQCLLESSTLGLIRGIIGACTGTSSSSPSQPNNNGHLFSIPKSHYSHRPSEHS